jgi:DNA-binding NarL/FixJ family response regulator
MRAVNADGGDRHSDATEERIHVVIAESRRLIGAALVALMRAIDPMFHVELLADATWTADRVAGADLLLVTVGREGGGEFESIRSLGANPASPKVILVADVLEPELVHFVLEERCNGLILTDTAPEDFAACLAQVAHGQAVLPANWQVALARVPEDPLAALSERQLEVLTLLAEGSSHEEIGARLFITPNTVKFHLRSIYDRLGVNNRLAAARVLAEHQHRRRRGADPSGARPAPGSPGEV